MTSLLVTVGSRIFHVNHPGLVAVTGRRIEEGRIKLIVIPDSPKPIKNASAVFTKAVTLKVIALAGPTSDTTIDKKAEDTRPKTG